MLACPLQFEQTNWQAKINEKITSRKISDFLREQKKLDYLTTTSLAFSVMTSHVKLAESEFIFNISISLSSFNFLHTFNSCRILFYTH